MTISYWRSHVLTSDLCPIATAVCQAIMPEKPFNTSESADKYGFSWVEQENKPISSASVTMLAKNISVQVIYLIYVE